MRARTSTVILIQRTTNNKHQPWISPPLAPERAQLSAPVARAAPSTAPARSITV
jgi:hypothetical protein